MRHQRARASTRFAVRAMERATLGAPSEVRDRFHDELVAEMHGLGTVAAWRYAFGVAASASSMRAALSGAAPVDASVPPATRPPLACRINVRHSWRTAHTSDGKLYRACARCGKEYVSSGTAGMIGG